MLKYNLQRLKESVNNKNILITTHNLVDIDGFSSCLVFKSFLEKLNPSTNIFLSFPEFLRSTKNFINSIISEYKEFNFRSFNSEELHQLDLAFILDTNNLDQLSQTHKNLITTLNLPYIFIDHHYSHIARNYLELDKLTLIEEGYSSTAELIYDLFTLANYNISKELKILLCAAIITDSGFFHHASNDTFSGFSALLSDDINFQEVLSLLEVEEDLSEKIAKIKAFQRVKVIKVSDWLIGVTHVSNFAASAASNLINNGFDVCIVYSKEINGVRITTRAKKQVCVKTGLNLAKILDRLTQGAGGGHNGAASVLITQDQENILNTLIEMIKKTLINEISL
jgi:nanoRNase/pAp phosphatase (c-di-AMP/oligoRNAs hydrolase)